MVHGSLSIRCVHSSEDWSSDGVQMKTIDAAAKPKQKAAAAIRF